MCVTLTGLPQKVFLIFACIERWVTVTVNYDSYCGFIKSCMISPFCNTLWYYIVILYMFRVLSFAVLSFQSVHFLRIYLEPPPPNRIPQQETFRVRNLNRNGKINKFWLLTFDFWHFDLKNYLNKSKSSSLNKSSYSILCEDNTILWISKLCSRVSLRWCFIELVWKTKEKNSVIILNERSEFHHKISEAWDPPSVYHCIQNDRT